MDVYLVGGAVRDTYLRCAVKEHDYVVVGATPDELLIQGFQPLDSVFPVFVNPKTGHEYALARREWKTGSGYKGFQIETSMDVTLEQDLIRRDLTINALAQDAQGRLIDPFNGLADLRRGILRHISPAFVEDPVRLLRLARFAARFNFEVAPETWPLLLNMARAAELTSVLPDRFRMELFRAFDTAYPWRFFEILQDCGALARLLPSLMSHLVPALNALRRAAHAHSDIWIRAGALWATALPDVAAVVHFGQALRLEQALTTLLKWAIEWPVTRIVNANEEELLVFWTQQRRFTNMPRLQAIWTAIDTELAMRAEARLMAIKTALAHIHPESLLAEGWQGAALGMELHRRRLHALRHL